MPIIQKSWYLDINVSGLNFFVFFFSEYEEISVELHNVGQAAMFGAFTGACLGGFAKSKDAYVYFIENNQATIFKSTLQAKVMYIWNTK